MALSHDHSFQLDLSFHVKVPITLLRDFEMTQKRSAIQKYFNMVKVKSLLAWVKGKIAAFGAAAVAAAATKNEKLKETFMDLGADGRLIQLVQRHARDDQVLNVACEAIKSLVTADDGRRPESKADTLIFFKCIKLNTVNCLSRSSNIPHSTVCWAYLVLRLEVGQLPSFENVLKSMLCQVPWLICHCADSCRHSSMQWRSQREGQ